MTNLQCAKFLLKLLEENKSKFDHGLCGFICILCKSYFIINYDKYLDLTDFIIRHNPKVFPTKLRYSRKLKLSPDSFYFKMGDYRKRKKWLQEIIKYYEKL